MNSEGPLDDARRVLGASGTRFLVGAALLALALDAILNSGAGMAGPLRSALLALLALSMGVAAVRERSVAHGLSAVGLLLVALAPGDGLRGQIVVGTQAPEAVMAGTGSRRVPHHLGGTLRVAEANDGLELSLQTGRVLHGKTTVPLDGQGGAQLAGWRWRLAEQVVTGDPTRAVIEFTPRDGKSEGLTRTLAVGQTIRLPDNSVAKLLRLTGDYGKSLGAAAWLQLDWKGQQEAAWHFVDAPDLDARVGVSPWRVRLSRVEAAPQIALQLTRGQNPLGAKIGWGIAALGLILGGFSFARGRS